MMAVMIGIDPHKGSHTAVAIGAAEEPLGDLRVRAGAAQADLLVAWAAGWPERTWAVEGAGGLGHLLAQQLVAAGERVLDVPPKLAARVRLLEAGTRTRTTRTTRCRSRSRRCAPRPGARWRPRIMRRCWRSGPSGTEWDVDVELVTRSPEQYWEMISEHVSLAVAALQQVDEPARERIRAHAIAKVSAFEKDGKVRVPGVARCIVGTK
jgi:hypothetical protein